MDGTDPATWFRRSLPLCVAKTCMPVLQQRRATLDESDFVLLRYNHANSALSIAQAFQFHVINVLDPTRV